MHYRMMHFSSTIIFPMVGVNFSSSFDNISAIYLKNLADALNHIENWMSSGRDQTLRYIGLPKGNKYKLRILPDDFLGEG